MSWLFLTLQAPDAPAIPGSDNTKGHGCLNRLVLDSFGRHNSRSLSCMEAAYIYLSKMAFVSLVTLQRRGLHNSNEASGILGSHPGYTSVSQPSVDNGPQKTSLSSALVTVCQVCTVTWLSDIPLLRYYTSDSRSTRPRTITGICISANYSSIARVSIMNPAL
ncbi:hypothetical protein F5X96DRAFT_628750 [Biscogniauxia mediterranea]|nr:hypothetical protein F5X96DRAFT_628750 [Biscogniauxia mediterranea]